MLAGIAASLSPLLLLSALALVQIVVPGFSDLKITKRRTLDQWAIRETLYLKGGRERIETELLTGQVFVGQNATSITINQCDQKRSFHLNPATKTYVRFDMKTAPGPIKSPAVPAMELSGGEVSVRINSIDTGERKQMGSYTARHIMTTRTVAPGPGASTPASVEEQDGWYIDLPGLGCQEQIVETQLSVPTSDRFRYQQLGNGKRGYPLEETTRTTQWGNDEISRVQLLEFMESPLDNSLFDLPAGYSPALRTLHGSFDMSKPDTLRNRIQEYWTELVFAARRIFRY